jgi:hypothetical protein
VGAADEEGDAGRVADAVLLTVEDALLVALSLLLLLGLDVGDWLAPSEGLAEGDGAAECVELGLPAADRVAVAVLVALALPAADCVAVALAVALRVAVLVPAADGEAEGEGDSATKPSSLNVAFA